MNDRLKKLILAEDDTDTITDEEDKLNDMIAAFHIPKPIRAGLSGCNSPHYHTLHSTTSTAAAAIMDARNGQGSPKISLSSKMSQALPPESSQQFFLPPLTTSNTAIPTVNVNVEEGGGEGEETLVEEQLKLHLLSVLAVLIPHMKFPHQDTRKESLRWLMWLHQQLPQRVCH